MSQAPERFTVWHGLLLAEAAALLISLLMPVTPSKTGSDFSPAALVFPEPTYVQEVFVYFILINLLLAVVGGALWIWFRASR